MNSVGRLQLATRGTCLLLVVMALVTACHIPYEQNDWEAYDGPGAEYFQAQEMEFTFDLMDDPLEPINRPISAFNYAFLYGVVQPLAWVYRTIVPKVARESIGKMFDNALYPARLVNNLLQAKWEGAGRETQRFLLNTTVGILGLFDPAKSYWGIEPSKEDMGQTFHKWGWRHSTFFVAPLVGPTTLRDGTGQIGDYFLDPLTHTHQPEGFYAQTFRTFNTLSDFIPGIVDFVERNYDAYQLSKLLFILNREIQTEDYSFHAEDTGETETLNAIFFKPEDPDWADKGETRTLKLSNGKQVIYTVWMQDEPAPIFYFVPGTGGHRLENSAQAVSEIAFRNGRHVVSVSSSLHTEFINNTLTAAVPGYLPSDSHDTHVAFDEIHADLVRRHGAGHFPKVWLGGLSLGGMTTLHIAAANADPEDTLLDFDTYIPINCPISLEHAVKTLDAFFNEPQRFPREQQLDRVRGVFRKALDLGTSGDLKPTDDLPFVDWEARFLIGFAFRLTIISTIQDTQDREDLGVLKTKRTWYRRSMSYLECSTFSFMEYLYAFVLPYYAERLEGIEFTDAGAEELFWRCDIRSLEAQLRGRDDIIYFSNRNDPLLQPADLEWIEQTLGEKAQLFEEGGHLGNLGQKEIQEVVHRAAEAQLQP